MIKPATYWRHQSTVREWLGRVGTVVGCTSIRTSLPELSYLLPYDFALVDFAGERREVMATTGTKLAVGDQVKMVLRKLGQADASGLIEYGLKLEKV